MLTILATPARAQSAASERKRAPRKILRLEGMKVEGRTAKPQAMFLFQPVN